MRMLGLETGYKLYLPEYKTYTHYKVPIGYMYFAKLEHMGDAKLHARSTGPVVGKTFQPVAGKSRGGAQRSGELDSYSMISYGLTTTLSEMFGPMSDDQRAKNEMINQIILTGQCESLSSKSNPTLELLNIYFKALLLEGE